MGNQNQAALVFRERQRQRVPHIQVKVVGRFVEKQQVGLLAHDDGQRQARALTT